MALLETHELLKGTLSHDGRLHRLTDEESDALKAVILEITRDVVGVCEELSIPYMLGGGSALGAVRHHGFIPWDDDLDLNVERQYIDSLLDAIKERYPDKYVCEIPMETEGYYSSFIQIHLKHTVFREYLWQEEETCGIKIDLFVIENTYDAPWRRRLHGLRVDAGLFLLSCYRFFRWRGEYLALASEHAAAKRSMRIKQLIGAPVALFPRAFYRHVQRLMRKCSDTNSTYVTIPSGRGHFFGELYERAVLLETEKMDFAGEKLSVTKNYDRYLTRLYGDYRTLPPEEKRERHVLYDLKLPGEMPDMRLLDKKEAQQELLGMLDAFVAYCKKHGLRYYLVGGTLLGAIRHRGFIPWDDDIDVGMPRPDYERFLKLEQQEPVAPYMRAISSKEGTLSNPYCELLHTNTRLERETSRYIREECQILQLFIDIFPQDGWPESDAAARLLSLRTRLLRYLILCSRARIGVGTNALRRALKAPVVAFSHLLGTKRLLAHIDRLAKKRDYDSSEYVGAITYGIYGVGERCKRERVVDFTEVEFEGRCLLAPGCADDYLRGIYGDYMQLPPEEKRKDHRLKVYLSQDTGSS